jgi:DNA-binding transcriptional ArsR family regulator
MTLLLRFRSADLLQCRFAISPLNETADALRALSNPKAAAYHLPWQRQARPLVPALGIEPLLAILSVRGYQPDFLSPAPGGPFTEIGAELDRVRATPPAKVAAELAECLDTESAGRAARSDHPELGGSPMRVRDLLAGMLGLVGRVRAVLLTALAEPASTTGLAARVGIPVSSVSEHLTILRATGLVSTTRTGRYLVHQRTALGMALAGTTDR